MAQPPSNAGSLVGQRLDEYELVALLALGGTAEIYLARHAGVAGFERYVVVKCLHDHLADDAEFVKMFLDEARLGAYLNHSNIVQTTALGSQKDRYYMVMEYLAGMSLSFVIRKAAERLPGGRLPVDVSLDLLIQACAGLHYAHQRRDSDGNPLRVVHRDVSPQNLVISFEGVLKVVDFGIAKAAVRDTRTQSGTIKGKFAYMSPEQCLGEDIDRRTDVFALGIIAHELLTGKRLFKRETSYDTYHAILECRVPPPSGVNSQLDAAFDPIVLGALAKNRDDRYPSAEAFGEALTAVLHKRGKSVSHGAVAQFFEKHFATEIDEHGERMRALIAGRKTTVDEQQWDDEDESQPAAEEEALQSAKALPKLPGVAANGAEAADTGDDVERDDDDGATRIELNPLDRVQQMHRELTGQQERAAVNAPGKKSAANGVSGSVEVNIPAPADLVRGASGRIDTARGPGVPVRTVSSSPSSSAPASAGRPPAVAPHTAQSDRQSVAAGMVAIGSIGPSSGHGPELDDESAEAKTIIAGETGPVSDHQGGQPAPAMPAGQVPDLSDMRTQIAPASHPPAGQVASPSGPAGAFVGPAELRTQIAGQDRPPDPIPSPYGSQFPGPADMQNQSLGQNVGPGGPPGVDPGAVGAGVMPGYGGVLDRDVQMPYPMPAQARQMHTNTHLHLMNRLAPPPTSMPVWLLTVIFFVCVGVGMGVTVLLASFL